MQSMFLAVPVPLEKQDAICVYKLATCPEYRLIGDVFGVHKSTVHKYFHIVVKAVLKLTSDLISFPRLDECIQNSGAFQKMCHIPNVIGAIDSKISFRILITHFKRYILIVQEHIFLLKPQRLATWISLIERD